MKQNVTSATSGSDNFIVVLPERGPLWQRMAEHSFQRKRNEVRLGKNPAFSFLLPSITLILSLLLKGKCKLTIQSDYIQHIWNQHLHMKGLRFEESHY